MGTLALELFAHSHSSLMEDVSVPSACGGDASGEDARVVSLAD